LAFHDSKVQRGKVGLGLCLQICFVIEERLDNFDVAAAGGKVERSPKGFLGAHIDGGAFAEQKFDEIAFARHGCQMQWRPAFGVLGAGIRHVREEQFGGLDLTFLGGVMQGSPTDGVALKSGVGALIQQGFESFAFAKRGSVMDVERLQRQGARQAKSEERRKRIFAHGAIL
jgi:hypothetical protein